MKLQITEDLKNTIIVEFKNGKSIISLSDEYRLSVYQLRKILPKKRKGKSRLSEEDRSEIKSQFNSGSRITELAERFNVSNSTISHITSEQTRENELTDVRKIDRRESTRAKFLKLLRLLGIFLNGEKLNWLGVAKVLDCHPDAVYKKVKLLEEGGFDIKKTDDGLFYLAATKSFNEN